METRKNEKTGRTVEERQRIENTRVMKEKKEEENEKEKEKEKTKTNDKGKDKDKEKKGRRSEGEEKRRKNQCGRTQIDVGRRGGGLAHVLSSLMQKEKRKYEGK